MSITWLWIVICLSHSAIFSGLNLGFFGLSRLRLAVQAETQNRDAKRILLLREDAHLLLATLLWGNVASNVLLALFAESILSGVGAFLFSTIGITFLGEIIPQAYLVKNTLRASKVLVPIIKLYQVLLYPIAMPTAFLLDRWLGKEGVSYFQENEIKVLLKQHAVSGDTNLEELETNGAINFLKIDDIHISKEGERLHPDSIIKVKTGPRKQVFFPKYRPEVSDPFIKSINKSRKKWVVFVNERNSPVLLLDADQFLRDVFFEKKQKPILHYCHNPIVIRDLKTPLGEAMLNYSIQPETKEDDVIDKDAILVWTRQKRIITGADILGRLLRGIIRQT